MSEEKKDSPISLDIWGLKLPIETEGQAPPAPKDYRDSWRRIVSALDRILVGVPEAIANIVEAVGKGAAAKIPPKAGEQIERGRVLAMVAEDEEQKLLEAGEAKALPAAEEAVDNLARLLAKHGGTIHQLEDGSLAVVVVPPEQRDEALARCIEEGERGDQITTAVATSGSSAQVIESDDSGE